MKHISVCIPTFSEPANCLATVKSIRETAGDQVEIVVVADGGPEANHPTFPPQLGVVLHVNENRVGSGPSRHLAASIATGQRILITDCHCVFKMNWLDDILKYDAGPETLLCGSMLALDKNHPTLESANGRYWGARFEILKNGKVLEAVWADTKDGDDYELQAVMGACYIMDREYYLKLAPHRFLRSFGNEEESLSLKVWLSGGEIRMAGNFTLGHRFRSPGERVPYDIPTSHILYNQMFTILTCLPKNYQEKLVAHFKQGADLRMATALIRNDWALVELEREHNRQIFTHDFSKFLEHFGLTI